MKKVMIKKVLPIVVVVALLVCCCVIPVSAASHTVDTGVVVRSTMESSGGPVIQGTQNTDGSYWINYYSGRTDNAMDILTPVSLVVSRGDVISVGRQYLNFYISNSETATVSCRLVLLDEEMRIRCELDSADVELYGSFGTWLGGTTVEAVEDFNVAYFGVRLVGNYATTSGTFSWRPYSFSLSCGDPTDILLEETNSHLEEITGDKYDNPADGELGQAAGDLNEKEDELNSSISSGSDEALGIFKAFELTDFADGLLCMVTLFDLITVSTAWYVPLIQISLALGLFSFIVGVSSIAVSVYTSRVSSRDREWSRYQKNMGKSAYARNLQRRRKK